MCVCIIHHIYLPPSPFLPLSLSREILLAFNKRKEKNYWSTHLQAQNPNLRYPMLDENEAPLTPPHTPPQRHHAPVTIGNSGSDVHDSATTIPEAKRESLPAKSGDLLTVPSLGKLKRTVSI